MRAVSVCLSVRVSVGPSARLKVYVANLIPTFTFTFIERV